jgi:hypothetical protein
MVSDGKTGRLDHGNGGDGDDGDEKLMRRCGDGGCGGA